MNTIRYEQAAQDIGRMLAMDFLDLSKEPRARPR